MRAYVRIPAHIYAHMCAYARIPICEFNKFAKPPQICKNNWSYKGNPLFVMHGSVEGTVRPGLIRHPCAHILRILILLMERSGWLKYVLSVQDFHCQFFILSRNSLGFLDKIDVISETLKIW